MYKEISVNKVIYKTLITTNFNSKNIKFLFKSTKNKEVWASLPGGTNTSCWVQKVNTFPLNDDKQPV